MQAVGLAAAPLCTKGESVCVRIGNAWAIPVEEEEGVWVGGWVGLAEADIA